MTLLEILVLAVVGALLGTLLGAGIGWSSGALGLYALRGAAIGLLFAFVAATVLVVIAVQRAAFRARKNGESGGGKPEQYDRH